MGWCSGTVVFDLICDRVLKPDIPVQTQMELVRAVANALSHADWDCESESAHWDDPVVKQVMQELHPDWFDPLTLMIDRLELSGFHCRNWGQIDSNQRGLVIVRADEGMKTIYAHGKTAADAWRCFLGWELNNA
jgi:hypothetical protein